MTRLTVERPNTIGVTLTKEFDTYPEDWIERQCERLADKGWEISELTGSTSRSGTIECTHDHQADTLLISWRTIRE